MVDQTVELLQKKVTSKRITIPSKKMIESASDVTDSESQETAKKVKSGSQKQANVKELVAKKLSVLKKKYDNTAIDKTSDSDNEITKFETPTRKALTKSQDSLMSTVDIVMSESAAPQKKADGQIPSTNTVKKSVVNFATPKNNQKTKEDIENRYSTKSRPQKPHISSKKIITNKPSEKIKPARANETAKPINGAQTDKNVTCPTESAKSTKKIYKKTDVSRSQSKPIINESVDAEAKKNRQDKETDRDQCSHNLTAEKHKNDGDSPTSSQCQVFASNEKLLNKKLCEAFRQIEELKTQKVSLSISRDEEREISKQMQLLNIELQKSVIDFFNEVKSNSSEVMNQAMTHILQDESAIPVGYERKRNQTIHLGHGVWLKKSTYNAVILNARTPAIFVKNMAVAMFGTSTLAMSSVTGTASNRLKKGKPNGNVKAKPKLNSIKMIAITAVFQHWLTKKVGNMISHKISDLNRSAHQKNKTAEVVDAETVSDPEDEDVDLPDDRGNTQIESDSSIGSNVANSDISKGGSFVGDASARVMKH